MEHWQNLRVLQDRLPRNPAPLLLEPHILLLSGIPSSGEAEPPYKRSPALREKALVHVSGSR